MSTQTPSPDRARVQQHTNNDELIRKGAPDGRNRNGTFAPGNRGSWKHGAYSRQTRRALVEEREAAAALADHCQEIETDLGGDASRLKRDLVRRYVETAALAAYLRVLDRQHRLATALGLERRARPVADVDSYLDQFPTGDAS